ncbi:hypothetical protein [Microbacterium sp. NPDC089695]|uniref:hypothetical protein n=1 Tax=Microbacterium sp. NPDC089695 TaxID=3364198 RepID=UPI003829E5F6
MTLTPLAADGTIAGAATEFSSETAASARVQAAATQCWQTSKRTTTVNAVGVGLFDIWVEGTWCDVATGGTSSATFNRSWSTIGTVGRRDAGQMYKGALANNGSVLPWGSAR